MPSSGIHNAADHAADEPRQQSDDHTSPHQLPAQLWDKLPLALFDRVCSYVSWPVLDTLSLLSAVCRQWSQLLDGDACGRFDSWRHVPLLAVQPRDGGIVISDGCQRRRCQPGSIAPMLHALRRISAIEVWMDGASHVAPYIVILDLLCSEPAASPSSASPPTPSSHPCDLSAARLSSRRVRLDHLTLISDMIVPLEEDVVQLSTALSHFLLRCPPLRSATIMSRQIPAAAALRRLCGSERLLHLQLNDTLLSAMVRADEPGAEQPWRTSSTLQSLVLLRSSTSHEDAGLSLEVLGVALPSLTHLHLPYRSKDDLQYVAQHLGSHLTFLRVGLDASFPQSVLMQCCALQSLHLQVDDTIPLKARVADHLHLLPQLTELTIIDTRTLSSKTKAVAVVLSSLPASLTYLQLSSDNTLLVAQAEGADPVELLAAVPPSLVYLSLTLLYTASSSSLLASLQRQCPHLARCHFRYLEYDGQLVGVERAEVIKKVQALRRQLGAAVWCESETAVEQQRLDRRWQRAVGVEVLDY